MSHPSPAPLADDPLIWQVRAFVYERFALTARPPSISDTAARFGIPSTQAANLYRELHARHALWLDGDSASVRMANPFSAIPTDFRVRAQGLDYWANCAWDALGIPAALHTDATINTHCAASGTPLSLVVHDDRLVASDAVVHFLVPFRAWYDDLVYT